MTLQEAYTLADELSDLFWKAHRWRADARTKEMMDLYNKEFAPLPGNKAYSMNCNPCIGHVVVFLRKHRKANSTDQATPASIS